MARKAKAPAIETREGEFGYWTQTDDGPVWIRTNEDGTPFDGEDDEDPIAVSIDQMGEDEDFVPLEQMEAEDDAEDYRPNSVVDGTYKAKYRARAAEMARKPKDVASKALARSCCDWLAIELARRCLTVEKKPTLVVPAFEALLDANGVKHSHWNRTTPGWQGRLRMTGRLALQRVVAEAGELSLPDGSAIPAPKNWVQKHCH